MKKYFYHQAGLSLIEVLLSLAIIAIFVKSLLLVQSHVWHSQKESLLQAIAITQLSSMAERLCANHSTIARQREFVIWNQQNYNVLPEGKGEMHCARKQCHVKVKWYFKRQHVLAKTMG